MISKQQAVLILEQSLSSGAEFAELFFENTHELNIHYADQKVQGVTDIQICGAGLHVINGEKSVYVHTNDTSFSSLMRQADRAAELIGQNGEKPGASLILHDRPVLNPNTVLIHPSTVSHQDKIRLLVAADKSARGTGISLSDLTIDYYDTDQEVRIANSEGLFTGEERVRVRMRIQVTLSDNGRPFYNWEELARPKGFEAFRTEGVVESFARHAVCQTRRMMLAVPAPPRTVPVVLEAGSCGTLWHESCGHALEASSVFSRRSAFTDQIGSLVASEKVTLLDDGSIPGLYGSSAIDDEGVLRRKNVLIENGFLRQYLCDRYHGRLIGFDTNGCGRRQNYTYAPTSRMSNTYLAPGQDDEDEMISSIPEGLYVRRIGGGTGGTQFSLEVKEGWWIKNGKLDYPVKGLTLTGNALSVIKKIDKVGSHLVFEDSGSFCGAESGLIPVTSSQPRVRITEMTLGGEQAI